MTCSVSHSILLEIHLDVTWVVALDKDVFALWSKKMHKWHFWITRFSLLALPIILHNIVPTFCLSQFFFPARKLCLLWATEFLPLVIFLHEKINFFNAQTIILLCTGPLMFLCKNTHLLFAKEQKKHFTCYPQWEQHQQYYFFLCGHPKFKMEPRSLRVSLSLLCTSIWRKMSNPFFMASQR